MAAQTKKKASGTLMNAERSNGKAPKKHPKDPNRNAREFKTPEQLTKIEAADARRKASLGARRAEAERQAIAAADAKAQLEFRRNAEKADQEARSKRRAEAKQKLADSKDASIRIAVAAKKAVR